MNKTLIGLLVGQFHRPPAKTLLLHLPSAAPLILRAEPENPYDPGAIAVLVDPKTAIPEGQLEALASALPLQGYTLEQVMSGGEIQLGYIAASGGKPLGKAQQDLAGQGLSLAGNSEFAPWVKGDTEGALLFAPDGRPLVGMRILEDDEEE